MKNSQRVFPIALSVLALGTVFLPWAEAGVALGAESVFGVEIPILGWSAIVAAFVLIGVSAIGVFHSSRWWWVAGSFVSALMITCAGLTLIAIDVVDSSAVKWIVEALPQSVEDASPSISTSFGLWAMLGVLLPYVALVAFLTVQAGVKACPDDKSQ
jgi:hypothetical protein